MINIKSSRVRRVVREYYSYMGENHVKVIDIVNNKYVDFPMLLVRFRDWKGKEMSSLLGYQEWKSGKLDVTEFHVCDRENEATMVKDFEESEEYKVVIEKWQEN